MKIYGICGEQGEYDDYGMWVLHTAFRTKEQAQKHIAALNKALAVACRQARAFQKKEDFQAAFACRSALDPAPRAETSEPVEYSIFTITLED